MDEGPSAPVQAPVVEDHNETNGLPIQPDNEQVPGRQEPKQEKERLPNGTSENDQNLGRKYLSEAIDRSDSEAETVVLDDKQDAKKDKAVNKIKLEDAILTSETIPGPAQERRNGELNGPAQNTDPRPSLKRKRGKEAPRKEDETTRHDSSSLSSTPSSPAPRVNSSKTSDSRSDRSASSPPVDDRTNGKLRKQRFHGNRQPQDNHDTSADANQVRARRETRSATFHEERSPKSESPPRTTNRAKSTQSNLPSNHGLNKRRKPAPLHVERRRRISDADSDGSSSVQSHHRLQKLQSTDSYAMSPVKISHKKNIDRSGRTLLARACTQGPAEAEKWIKERPQDIDIPDNAGNTPLQMASLQGLDEVVKLLIDAGCDLNCKNVDHDTPLIDAVENCHLEVVKLLLRAGVDPRHRNAQGQEPLELVDLELDDGEEMRNLLLKARKDSDLTRRQSEDQRHHARDGDTPSAPASGASPTESNRSPPPVDIGGRRRTARSQPTKDSLLWVNPTPQRLREEAGKGNLEIVDHILKMQPKVQPDAVLAAVKGGHDEVLGLMFAIAPPDPDPEPLQFLEHQPAYATPMLAAIGRGNTKVIRLILNQPGFDPTRRLFKGQTYPEIAEERKGEEWEEEVRMLQQAIDEHQKTGGRRSNTNSPRKVRTKRAVPKDESPEPSSSPHESRKIRRPFPKVNDDSDAEVKQRPSYHGTAVRQRSGSNPDHNSRDADRLSSRPLKARTRDDSNNSTNGTARNDSIKPKRKLMSGNDLRTDQEARRRLKDVDEVPKPPDQASQPRSRQSFSSHDGPQARLDDTTFAHPNVRKANSEEPVQDKEDSRKKRLRVSLSPQASRSELQEATKKVKRQRVNSQGKAVDQGQVEPAPSEPMIVDIVTSPTALQPQSGQGSAPVAFMGAPPIQSAAASFIDNVQAASGNNQLGRAIDLMFDDAGKPEASYEEANFGHYDSNGQQPDMPATSGTHPHDPANAKVAENEAEPVSLQEENELKEQETLGEQERIRSEEAAEARRESQRQAEEAERLAQQEREAEETRMAKLRREEELQRRRIDEENKRREEQERRKREREERERLRRLRQAQEAEKARIEALPNGLRRAAELGPDRARDSKEITKWLPLRTVTGQDLRLGSNGQNMEERWMANVQAAPLLAIQDLELSQCKSSSGWTRSSPDPCPDTAWTRLPASPAQVSSLWRQLRTPMSIATTSPFLGIKEAVELDNQTQPKFFNLKVFWIRLSDFLDIVPRHPHLDGINLPTRAIVLHDMASARSPTPGHAQDQKGHHGEPLVNGILPNGIP